MAKNGNLRAADRAKNDEFYTMLTDIEKEMSHYKDFFRGKVVYCNCDDARESNFFKYFSKNFEFLGLKKLITTGYKAEGKGVVLVYEGDKNGNRKVEDEEITIKELEGTGDFRSPECIEFLKEADVVVTNPPFSLFREYVKQLMDYGKKFILIGNKNAISYKEIFPYIKNNQLWIGNTPMGYDMKFILPEHYAKEVVESKKEGSAYVIKDGKVMGRAQAIWFTNVEHKKRHTPIDLYKRYSNEYPKYDNYDAIEVSKTCDIPMDYDGIMGVPITFLDKYCPEQFEIINGVGRYAVIEDTYTNPKGTYGTAVNGKPNFFRIFIRKRTA